MIRLITVLVLLICSATALAADPKDAPDAVLVELRSKLEKELSDLKPAPTFEISPHSGGKSMVMRYKTREYQVHIPEGQGRLSKDLHTEVGPDAGGLMLNVHVQAYGVNNQAVVPQTLRNPYWDTYLDVYPLAAKDKQIYCGLSSRFTTDKKLIERIKKILSAEE